MIDEPLSEPLDGEPQRRRFAPAWATLALMMSGAVAVASLSVDPPREPELVRVAPGTEGELAGVEDVGPAGEGGSVGVGGAAAGTGPGSAQAVSKGAAAQGPAKDAVCAAGKNGGSTDVGVTASSIKLGATVVQSGLGASFLGDVRFGMEAVVDKVNAAGGICGRRIDLKLIDDGWSYQLGGEYLRNLVEGEKVFALSVVPSAQGLKNISLAKYLQAKQVPAVGTDGMLISQYKDPWIWPVAASTVSTMHIMAKQAYDAGAKEFGLVYQDDYHFGIEGAYAFNAAVKRLTSKDIDGYRDPLTNPKCELRFCGISGTSDGYTSQIETFNGACIKAPDCEYIGLLLEPTTATKWMKGGALTPTDSRRMGGAQPLFTYDFGRSCGADCHGMWLWTGYTPPLGDFLGIPAVGTYVNDIKAASSAADYNNQFVLGGYVGMQLVVKSLQAVGPNLTRAGLKATLDAMTFDSGGLAPTMKWTPGNHFANTRMRAFSIQYKGGFNGWRDEQVAMDDPWVGQDG